MAPVCIRVLLIGEILGDVMVSCIKNAFPEWTPPEVTTQGQRKRLRGSKSSIDSSPRIVNDSWLFCDPVVDILATLAVPNVSHKPALRIRMCSECRTASGGLWSIKWSVDQSTQMLPTNDIHIYILICSIMMYLATKEVTLAWPARKSDIMLVVSMANWSNYHTTVYGKGKTPPPLKKIINK